MKSEFEKLRDGEYFNSLSDEIMESVYHARRLTEQFNLCRWDEEEKRREIIRELFGSTGEKVTVNPPFTCDHGQFIHVGENFFANYGCIIMDAQEVRFGANCMLGPRVCIYSIGHPVEDGPRNRDGLAVAKPVTVGDNVWIGANAVILPGVTIGDRAVVAAGAIVTKDVPPDTLVGGNPAVVIRNICN